MDRRKQIAGSLLLLLTAVIWGMAFVSQSKGMESMGPLTFQGVRCLIGAAAMLPLALRSISSLKSARRESDSASSARLDPDADSSAHQAHGSAPSAPGRRYVLLAGLAVGLVFSVACTLQQYGIGMTTVGKAGFITALYIILVPVFAMIFLKRRAAPVIWAGVGIALAGFYLLCLAGQGLTVSAGDMLVLASAAFFAVHILTVDHFVTRVDPVLLSWMQLVFCGAAVTVLALVFEHPTGAQILDGLPALLYAGVLSCGVAYTLQMVGQKMVPPATATLIMSLEAVVSALAGAAAWKLGILSTDQSMTGLQITGCALVFAAVIIVELPWRELRTRKKKLMI